jgi:dihydropyrimidinase
MPFDLVIAGGTVITDQDTFRADLGISQGKIAGIGKGLKGQRSIDAAGLHILPGGIDVHTHLELPANGSRTADDFYTGTVAAAFGGITTLLDYAFTEPGQRLSDVVGIWRRRAEIKSIIDFGFHVVVREATPEVLEEVPDLIAAGVTSFKVFMIQPWGLGDRGLLALLQKVGPLGGLVTAHCEDGPLCDRLTKELLAGGHKAPRYAAQAHPVAAEAAATAKAMAYAELAEAPIYVVHLSCAEALEHVQAARSRGVQALAETRPIYLFLDESHYSRSDEEATLYMALPPLRAASQQRVLWDALRTDQLQTVASDHTSWTKQQKAANLDDFTAIPVGVPSLQREMPLLYAKGVNEGRLSLNRFAAISSTNQAKIFGLYPRKGAIAVGSDADLAIYDPKLEVELSEADVRSAAGYEPYAGLKLRGYPVMTISRGEVIVDHGRLQALAGRGQFLARRKFSWAEARG